MTHLFALFACVVLVCAVPVRAAQSIHDLIVLAPQTVIASNTVSVTNNLPIIGVVKGYGVYAVGDIAVTSTVFELQGSYVTNQIDATARTISPNAGHKASVSSVPLLNEKVKFTFVGSTAGVATSTVTVTPYILIEK